MKNHFEKYFPRFLFVHSFLYKFKTTTWDAIYNNFFEAIFTKYLDERLDKSHKWCGKENLITDRKEKKSNEISRPYN